MFLNKNNEIASCKTAYTYPKYNVVLNPYTDTKRTKIPLRNVFINKFDVGINNKSICIV